MKKVISYIFSFFLALFLFFLTVICVLRFTALGESYFLSTLDRVDYYESAVMNYNRLLRQNARPTNFPIELFEDYVKTVDVIDDMKGSVEAAFQGEDYAIDTTVFEERLKNTTDTYIAENHITVDAKTEEAIQMFIDANTENYGKLLQFPYMEYLGKAITIFHKVFWMLFAGLVVLNAILIFAQLRLHKSRRRKKRWLAYSMIGAGLMSGVLPALLLGQRIFDRIQIEPKYLYEVIRSLMNGSMVILLIVSVIWIILGFCLTYIKIKKKKKSKHHERNYDHAVQLDSIVKE